MVNRALIQFVMLQHKHTRLEAYSGDKALNTICSGICRAIIGPPDFYRIYRAGIVAGSISKVAIFRGAIQAYDAHAAWQYIGYRCCRRAISGPFIEIMGRHLRTSAA